MGSPPPYSGNPGYDALRLAADWSSAVRDTTLFFDYAGDTIAIVDPPPPTEPDPAPVPVATAPSASWRPPVLSATIHAGEYGSLTVSRDHCSAMFWSESAVEKFLFPYYASAAGADAWEVLGALSAAVYDSSADAPWCAITFRYPSPGVTGTLSIWSTMGVVYGTVDDTGTKVLRHEPLLEFLRDIPKPKRGGPTLPGAVEPDTFPAPASSQPGAVDSIGAREVAEYVSGLRGHLVRVYRDPDGLDPTLSRASGELLFEASAPLFGPARPTVTVELEVGGPLGPVTYPLTGENVGSGPAYDPDSVFWSDGSVEMLLLPYYASVKGHHSPWFLIALLGKWAGVIPTSVVDALVLLLQVVKAAERLVGSPAGARGVGAVVDRLPSDAGGVEDEVEDGGLVESDVFSIIPLPRSEYVDAGAPLLEAINVESRTWLLTLDGAHPLVSPKAPLLPRRPVRG